MPVVTLNEMDVRAFLTAFNAIAEVTGFDFTDETEYRLAIANLVGELKSQLPPVPRESLGVTPRVVLAAVLAGKYAAWDDECAGGAVCQSADDLIVEALDKGGYDSRSFSAGGDADAAIGQLRTLLTVVSAAGWNRYELTLCAATRDEIDRLKLSDMLEVLCVADDGPRPGGSFWRRWRKA